MRILALDLGKYKTVACEYEAETGKHRFVTVRISSMWMSASTSGRAAAECGPG
jgi:hypothetical protein